jgi:exopolysaccharide production protein ExoQ
MLKLFEKGFAVFMLLFCCGMFSLYFSESQVPDLTANSNPELFALQACVYGIAALVCLLHAKQVCTAAFHSPYVLSFVFFAIASTAWSQNPSLTLRRSLVFAATALYGMYFGSRFDLEEQISLIAWTLLLALLASAAMAIFLPSVGTETELHIGSWRGLFPQKNMLAKVAVLAGAAFLFWAPRNRLLSRLALAFAVITTVMTGSATGIVVLTLILLIYVFLHVMKRRVALSILALVLLVVFLFAVVALSDMTSGSTLALLGRDTTLSGRTVLWRLVLDPISQQPLLGYGFSAFWLQTTLQAEYIIRSVGWITPHAHNGVLNIWLELGAIGVFLCSLAYGKCVLDAVQIHRARSYRDSLWPLVFLVFLLLYNITEVTAPQPNSIFVVLFVATAVRVAMIRRPTTDRREEYARLPLVQRPVVSASNIPA